MTASPGSFKRDHTSRLRARVCRRDGPIFPGHRLRLLRRRIDGRRCQRNRGVEIRLLLSGCQGGRCYRPTGFGPDQNRNPPRRPYVAAVLSCGVPFGVIRATSAVSARPRGLRVELRTTGGRGLRLYLAPRRFVRRCRRRSSPSHPAKDKAHVANRFGTRCRMTNSPARPSSTGSSGIFPGLGGSDVMVVSTLPSRNKRESAISAVYAYAASLLASSELPTPCSAVSA